MSKDFFIKHTVAMYKYCMSITLAFLNFICLFILTQLIKNVSISTKLKMTIEWNGIC